MAKRRKRRSGGRKVRTRTRTVTKTRWRTRHHKRSRRRRSHGGGSRALMPNKSELMDYAMAAGYGFVEKTAKADANFFLNKVPKPIPQIGYAGNLALGLRVVNALVLRKPILGRAAHIIGEIAAYQLGRNGELFKDAATPVSIAGDDDIAGELDDGVMGALAAEGEMGWDDADEANDTMEGDDDLEGVPLDDVSGDEGDAVLGLDDD